MLTEDTTPGVVEPSGQGDGHRLARLDLGLLAGVQVDGDHRGGRATRSAPPIPGWPGRPAPCWRLAGDLDRGGQEHRLAQGQRPGLGHPQRGLQLFQRVGGLGAEVVPARPGPGRRRSRSRAATRSVFSSVTSGPVSRPRTGPGRPGAVPYSSTTGLPLTPVQHLALARTTVADVYVRQLAVIVPWAWLTTL